MQQRRATAEQWLLADPVLAAGEIGYETDTTSFKIGDGVNNWSLLDYFETNAALQATVDDYIPLTQKGAPLGVAELDANGFVPASQLDLDLTAYYTSAETDTAISTAVSGLVDSAPGVLDTLNELAAAINDDADFATTVTTSISSGDAATLASAQSYADQAELDAVATANAYTDAEIAAIPPVDLTGYATETYADQAEADAKTYADGLASNYDAAGSAAAAESAANTYTDGEISTLDTSLKAYADTAESDAVGTANAYTDTTVADYAPLAGATFTGDVVLNADPTQALGAATKQYVDSLGEGLVAKPAVKASTSSNATGAYDNGTAGVGATFTFPAMATFNIDGVTSWELYDGLLLRSQTNAAENGRYVLTTVGDGSTPWVFTRCGLCDEADEIPGAYIFVTDGVNSGQTGWVLHVDDPATFTVGTDDIDVYQFAGAGTYSAGTGLQLDGTQFSIDTSVTATTSYVDTAESDAIATANSYTDGRETAITTAIQTQLDGKAASSHTHAQSDITDLVTDLAAKAPLASPSFTGTVDFSNATVQGIEIPQPLHPFSMIG
jgi:hypothetical protein